MNSKNYKVAVVVMFLVTLFSITVTVNGIAGDTEAHRATLKGLKGVEVVIEAIQPEVQKDGLTMDLLRTDVELRLRKAGIKVMTMRESVGTPGKPYLYVCVSAFKNEEGIYLIDIMVELKQVVLLMRDPSISISAATWHTYSIMRTGLNQIESRVREVVRDNVDKFINAYLAVNPN